MADLAPTRETLANEFHTGHPEFSLDQCKTIVNMTQEFMHALTKAVPALKDGSAIVWKPSVNYNRVQRAKRATAFKAQDTTPIK